MSVPRDELLAAEEKAWEELHAYVNTITDGEWDKPGCTGDWSPKDLVAHTACWSAEAARRLECIRAEQRPDGPDFQKFNDEAYEACKNLSVKETLAMFHSAHHRLQEEIEQVAPVALSGKTSEMIRECGARHYREHLVQLKAFLGER